MSRAGQFNESRAHQRRAGRAGGFGGGGDDVEFPDPQGGFLFLSAPFVYNWDDGSERGGHYHTVEFFSEVMGHTNEERIVWLRQDEFGSDYYFLVDSSFGFWSDGSGVVAYFMGAKTPLGTVAPIIVQVPGEAEFDAGNLFEIGQVPSFRGIGGPARNGVAFATYNNYFGNAQGRWGIARLRNGQANLREGEYTRWNAQNGEITPVVIGADETMIHGGSPVPQSDMLDYDFNPFRVVRVRNKDESINLDFIADQIAEWDDYAIVKSGGDTQTQTWGGGASYAYYPIALFKYDRPNGLPEVRWALLQVALVPSDNDPNLLLQYATGLGLSFYGLYASQFNPSRLFVRSGGK